MFPPHDPFSNATSKKAGGTQRKEKGEGPFLNRRDLNHLKIYKTIMASPKKPQSGGLCTHIYLSGMIERKKKNILIGQIFRLT